MKVRSTQQALEEAQRLIAMFPGIMALAQDVVEISSIQSAADAAEKRKDELDAAVEQARQDLATVKAESAEAARKAESWGSGIKLRAEADAQLTRDNADKDAETVRGAAQGTLDAAEAEAEKIVLTARNAALAITERSKAAQIELDRLTAEVAAVRAALDAAHGEMQEIADAKAALAARLG